MRGNDGKTRMKFYQISSDEDRVKEPRCMWPLFFSRAGLFCPDSVMWGSQSTVLQLQQSVCGGGKNSEMNGWSCFEVVYVFFPSALRVSG